MNIWIENISELILYNMNGTSIVTKIDKVLSLESADYSFTKEYGDDATALAAYNALKASIVAAGGTIIAP